MDTNIPRVHDNNTTFFLNSLDAKLDRNNKITKANINNINASTLLISNIQEKIDILQTKLIEINNYILKLTEQNKRFSNETLRIEEKIEDIKITVNKYNQDITDLYLENNKLNDKEQHINKDTIWNKMSALEISKKENYKKLKDYKTMFPFHFQHQEDLEIVPPVDFNEEGPKQTNFKNKYLKYKIKYITLKKQFI